MPTTILGTLNYGEEKMDILSMLENSGVEFLVYKIIHMLDLRDICSLLQVCTNWNSWDTDYLWKQELLLKRRYEEEKQLKSVLKASDSPKKCVQTLWRLQQSWRTVDRSGQSSVVLDSSVLSITCQDSSHLLCALNSGELVQVELGTGTEKKRKEIHNKGVKHVSIHPVTKRLWTGSYDGEVKVWDQSWCQLTGVRIGVAVTDLCFYEDSVFISGDDTTIRCYTGAAHGGDGDLSLLWSLSMPGGEMMNCLTVWTDRLVSGSDGGLLEVRSTETGQVISSLEGHERGCGISGLAVNHMGLWSASFDCKMALWSDKGDCLCVLIGHTQPIRCLAVDQFKVVSGDYRGFVMIWDLEDIQREIWQSQLKEAKKKHVVSNSSSKAATSGIYRMRGRQVIQTGHSTCEVLQHSSILEHHGNVTEVILVGPDVLVSSSRDRTCNIHQFSTLQKSRKYERKSYL